MTGMALEQLEAARGSRADAGGPGGEERQL